MALHAGPCLLVTLAFNKLLSVNMYHGSYLLCTVFIHPTGHLMSRIIDHKLETISFNLHIPFNPLNFAHLRCSFSYINIPKAPNRVRIQLDQALSALLLEKPLLLPVSPTFPTDPPCMQNDPYLAQRHFRTCI